MRRIWKIYRLLAAQNLKRLMEYRADFLTGAVSFLIDQAIGIAFIFIILHRYLSLQALHLNRYCLYTVFLRYPKDWIICLQTICGVLDILLYERAILINIL